MSARASSSQRTISWPSLLCRGLDASTIRREGAIKITRAGSGPGAGLIDFDGIGSLRELR